MNLHCDPSELIARAKAARKEGRKDDARAALVDCVAIVTQMGDQAGLAEVLVMLGEVERHRGDLTASAEAYGRARDAFRAVSNREGIAHVLRHRIDINREAGAFGAAEAELDEALVLHRAGDTASLNAANMLRVAALLKQDQGDNAAALHFWRETRDAYAACDELLQKLTGHNPGVEEAERRIAALI